jgi:hypothetical protein
MVVLPPANFPDSPASQAEGGRAKVALAARPISRFAPADNPSSGNGNSHPSPVPDTVKVQVQPPGEILVYQFVNQQGTVVLQVPPQQLIELAKLISQELAEKLSPQSATPAGRKDNGH